jgi:hypothetical protein
VARRVLFLALGLGELVRLLLLAILGADVLLGSVAGGLAAAAWLLVFLAPHIAVAAAFLFMAAPASSSAPWIRILIPAKLIGTFAAAAAIAAEVSGSSPSMVDLTFLPVLLPAWLLLALVAFWDAGTLAILVALAILGRQPTNPGDPEPDAVNPVYREADVEVVMDDPPADASP